MLQLATILSELPAQTIWSLGGIGRFQARSNALGVVMGDGVRVGLEDNLWWDLERTKLATNAELVQRIVCQAEALNRTIATPLEARARLGLTKCQ